MPTALIWGASGGIGAATADALRAAGWRVLAVARTPRPEDPDEDHYAADLTHEADVAAAALWAAQQVGSVGLWVFAAGEMLGKSLAETSLSDWQRIMAANVTAAHLAVVQSLVLVDPDGHMVFVGAYADKILLPKIGAYAAAKAALDSYVRVLTKELRGRRVTLVRVGAVDTPFWKKAPFRLPRGAQSPATVAAAIVRSFTEGHTGDLDL